MSLGIHFPILLSQENRQYLVWSAVSVKQEVFTVLHETFGKEWIDASLNAVDISNTQYIIVFFSDFNVIYFLANSTYFSNGLRDFSIIIYVVQNLWKSVNALTVNIHIFVFM
jgi:hypothetical protein